MRASTRWPSNAAAVVCTAVALSACASPPPTSPPVVMAASARNEPALAVMERVALSARDCWFRGNDPAFAAYRLAPELDSYSGRPRILIVPARNPGGLPLLVVEAEGSPARLDAYGPLLQSAEGNRIAADVRRWSAGSTDCRRA